jgi:hypothetical protein
MTYTILLVVETHRGRHLPELHQPLVGLVPGSPLQTTRLEVPAPVQHDKVGHIVHDEGGTGTEIIPIFGAGKETADSLASLLTAVAPVIISWEIGTEPVRRGGECSVKGLELDCLGSKVRELRFSTCGK